MEDLSEKEQIELMRSWWSENGIYVILGVLISVGSIVGLLQLRASQVETQMAASALFEALAEEVAENRVDEAETIASDVYANHAKSIYADQTRLAMARLYMDQGRDQDAATTLRELVDGDADSQMQLVGRLRLGKVLLYQGAAEEVLTLVDAYTSSGMGPRFSELQGDAHFALGDYARAETAYMAALNDPLASQLVDAGLLRMKISDLPEVLPETGAGESGTDTDVLEEEQSAEVEEPADDSAAAADDEGSDDSVATEDEPR